MLILFWVLAIAYVVVTIIVTWYRWDEYIEVKEDYVRYQRYVNHSSRLWVSKVTAEDVHSAARHVLLSWSWPFDVLRYLTNGLQEYVADLKGVNLDKDRRNIS